MKKAILFCLLVLFGSGAFGVSMNFHGSVRTDGSLFSKLDLGASGSTTTKSYLGGRVLLNPNVIVDDHFSIRSQWSLLTSPTLTPSAIVPLGSGQGGFVYGDVNTSSMVLSRVWLEWTSDFGVVRLGRMPVSWGYGLVWDAGEQPWDDYQTNIDRLEYRLHLGNVIGALAYSKGRKISVLGSDNDQEYYSVYLRYHNPQADVEGGILYEYQKRTLSQQPDLLGTSAGQTHFPNPYKLPASVPAAATYYLSNKMPWPWSNNIMDVYLKKTVGYFTFGGEVGWLSGEAVDYNQDGVQDKLNAFSGLASVSYAYHKIKTFVELLYAGGDSNLLDGGLNGFVLLHRGRRPGLILGRELLGPYHGNHAGFGSLVVYGNQDSFSGVFYARPGFRIDWSRSWAAGIEFIYAQKASVAPGENPYLGFEVDLGLDYAVYRNFDLGFTLGYLFPGSGLRVTDPKGVYGININASLKF